MARRRRRKTGKMRVGDCRVTRTGRAYCRFKEGVRFVPNAARGMRGLGVPVVARDLFLAGGPALSGRRGKMRIGECRRTRQGRKYCKRKKGVRFVRG